MSNYDGTAETHVVNRVARPLAKRTGDIRSRLRKPERCPYPDADRTRKNEEEIDVELSRQKLPDSADSPL
jgi:hypothetical protein